ncbi:DUF4391 domain-containing protein [Lagierella sp.]|uniref:DUF4391 domain-containing protein n=1 Tax=Lagierella sp. TaxID=2849657 RepID=UPI00261D4F89|nr:DUF4391 domain-containing protein [Lagierella sp.]
MFNLPKSTKIKKNIYKNTIYKKFSNELIGKKKENFDKEIKKITITNEISEQSISVKPTEEVSAIFLVLVELKIKEFNEANISLVSRLFGQRILLILKYEDKYKLAIYETRLLMGEWKEIDQINVKIQGLDLSSVWDNFVIQVGKFEVEEGNSLVEQIEIEEEKEKLKQKIEKTEKKARKEQQAKKKFEIFKKLKEYKRELEEM